MRVYFPDVKIITNDNEKYSLFKNADFACAASGTVVLELGLTDTPTIVIYKMDKFTWFFVSKMVKVQFVSLVNLILGRESSKELLQDRYTKENLINEYKISSYDASILVSDKNNVEYFDKINISSEIGLLFESGFISIFALTYLIYIQTIGIGNFLIHGHTITFFLSLSGLFCYLEQDINWKFNRILLVRVICSEL